MPIREGENQDDELIEDKELGNWEPNDPMGDDNNVMKQLNNWLLRLPDKPYGIVLQLEK